MDHEAKQSMDGRYGLPDAHFANGKALMRWWSGLRPQVLQVPRVPQVASQTMCTRYYLGT